MQPERQGRLLFLWRSSAARLIAVYGALFVACCSVLIGVIQWEMQRYLGEVVDQLLQQRGHYFTTVDPEQLPDALAAASAADVEGFMAYGLFAADGHRLSGNIAYPPANLPPDGGVRLLRHGIKRLDRIEDFSARALALPLVNGGLLVLARATSVIDQVGVILRQSLLWALSLTLIPGVVGGYLLSRAPLRRVRMIEEAVQPIIQGDLGRRLPVSGRGDEIDLLAGIVNTMLAELERLIGEVKGVCDNIAHDLRTPLTSLRMQLYRLQQTATDHDAELLERCVGDVDAVLRRFAALLRISELEDLRRREGFGSVDLATTLRDVHELFAPLAEDKQIELRLRLDNPPPIRADRELVFEAISNLVGNAIKFTQAGGLIELHAGAYGDGVRISVADNGPGISAGERDAVLQRFFRGEGARQLPGSGLGLSIVSAIARLHSFDIDIGTTELGGACVTLYCVGNASAINEQR